MPAKNLRELIALARKQPGKLTRLVANMEWALEDLPGVHDIVEYEARLNYVLPEYHDPVVCTYDLSRFHASVVMDIMRTHPMLIVSGILQENPFYVPPDEMLANIRCPSLPGAQLDPLPHRRLGGQERRRHHPRRTDLA